MTGSALALEGPGQAAGRSLSSPPPSGPAWPFRPMAAPATARPPSIAGPRGAVPDSTPLLAGLADDTASSPGDPGQQGETPRRNPRGIPAARTHNQSDCLVSTTQYAEPEPARSLRCGPDCAVPPLVVTAPA